MRQHAGQAARGVFMFTRRLLSLAFALAVVGLALLLAVTLRLSSGPIALPWLIRPLEAALVAGPGAPLWHIGTAELAWEGFSGGLDRPLDIRVTDVSLTTADGRLLARLPEARVSLAMRELLLHRRLIPRGLELRGAELHARRTAAGLTLDLSPPEPDAFRADTIQAEPAITIDSLIAALLRPVALGTDDPLSQLRRIAVREAILAVDDRIANRHWSARNVMLDLRRADTGGAEGTAAFDAPLGEQTLHLDARIALTNAAETVRADLRLSPLNPARLAAELAVIPEARAVDADVALETTLVLDRALAFRRGEARLRLGPGRIAVARGSIPLSEARAIARFDRATVSLSDITADIPTPSGPPAHIAASGSLILAAEGYDATLALTLDQIAATDVGTMWPEGVAGKGTKPWIMRNITAGRAQDLHATIGLHAPADLSDIAVTSLAGGMQADGITLHWLSPVPPLEQVQAELTFVSPDIVDFGFTAGRQGNLRLTNGLVRIFGLAARDQVADISADIAGPLADVIAVLRHPRLRLLDRRPIEMRDPAGSATGRLDITALPLESWLTVEDVKLKAAAKLAGVHLGAIAAGRDLDQGNLDLAASNDGLKVSGTAMLAGIASKLALDMDFRPGAPGQIVQSVAVAATPEPAQLAAAGLDLGGTIQGAAPVSLVWRARRDGKGDLSVTADLAPTTLALDALGFTKPPGRPAKAELRASLDRDRIAAIDRLTLSGDGIDAEARIGFTAGRPATAAIARLRLGADTDLRADIGWPARDGAAWRISLTGTTIDAAAQLRRAPPNAPPGPPYVLDARLDRALLGDGRRMTQVVLHAENDGRTIAIAPVLGGRTLSGTATDAGALLHALDLVDDMQGGAMDLAGRYDDSTPEHRLTGTATITDFRMIKAPGLAKLLQAMTFYGLVELMRGPGLGFVRLEAPFSLAGDTLDLNDARAFNSSLGMTAKGRIDMARGRCDVGGTIVPAYFFNSLLGNLPLIGRLFSAERGGGLFAANYSLSGDCNDPAIGINPLAALTPGFLRGIFGLFDTPDAPSNAPRAPASPAH